MAFLKAADTRSNASFAIRAPRLHGPRWLGNLGSQGKSGGKEPLHEKD